MEQKISPEEKLLQLIKNGGKKEAADPPVQQKTQASAVQKRATANVPKKQKEHGTRLLSLFNKILVLCMFGMISYAVYIYINRPSNQKKIEEMLHIQANAASSGDVVAPQRPLPYYTDIISRRSMFKIYETPVQKPVGPPKPKVTLPQLLANYTFVGIIFGDEPQAIVEDKKSGQSYYLTSGQSLGEIKIDAIGKGKVTVSYEDETMDINI